MAEQEREQIPNHKQDPAEIENIEVTELEDQDLEDVSGGASSGNNFNCNCSET